MCYGGSMEEKEVKKRFPNVQILEATHERLKAYKKGQPMRPTMCGIVDVALNQFLDRAGWPS